MKFATEIKTALKAAGLDEGLFDQITVESEDEIEGAVKSLLADLDKVKNLTEQEFLDALEKAGLSAAYTKATQREADKRVTDALKTQKDKLDKEAADAAAKKLDDEGTSKMTDSDKATKELTDKINSLEGMVNKLTSSVSKEGLRTKIRSQLKAEGLNEEFEVYINTDDPDAIEDAVKTFKATFEGQQQATIDEQIKAGTLAKVQDGKAGETLDESNIAEFAKSIGKNGLVANPDFTGKLAADNAVKAD